MLRFEGEISRIIFEKQESNLKIFELYATDKRSYECVGQIDDVEIGDIVSFMGESKRSNGHEHGELIMIQKDSFCISKIETTDQMIQFLGREVPGIGEKTARAIVDHFGMETEKTILCFSENLVGIGRVTKEKAKFIHSCFSGDMERRNRIVLFQKLDISEKLGERIVDAHPDDYETILTKNPFQLIDEVYGIGFLKADDIAIKAGIDPNSEIRICAGIEFVLDDICNRRGSTLTQIDYLCERLVSINITNRAAINNALMAFQRENRIVTFGKSLSLKKYYVAENAIAIEVAERSGNPDLLIDEEVLTKKLDEEILPEMFITLEKEQRKAVVEVFLNFLSIIIGGPGTGKTTVANVIKEMAIAMKLNIMMLAPTGRAASRLCEVTGILAKTIHSVLMPFADNEGNDVKDGFLHADIILIDEMSMVDMFLFRRLLKHIRADTKIVLVGDPNQLPSIGPGSVLRDLIESEVVVCTRLINVFRQSGKNTILANASHVLNGEDLEFPDFENDFVFLEVKDEDAHEVLDRLYNEILPNYFQIETDDISILCPQNKGLLGVHDCNTFIQNQVNPRNDTDIVSFKEAGFEIRVGDKVMNTRNNYRIPYSFESEGQILQGKGLFNGEIGRVLAINSERKEIVVDFDGKKCVFDDAESSNLKLAYAMTIHKSQGCEMPVAIIPLFEKSTKMLMTRKLLYTAITRPRISVVIIGKREILDSMISNTFCNARITGLKYRIQYYFKKIM